MRGSRFIFAMAWMVLCLAFTGCNSVTREPLPLDDEVADRKVDAMKRLAESMAREPDGAEARGALEEFRNTVMDVRKNPKQAEQIAEIFRTQIQNKYRGFVAQEIRGEMAAFNAAVKAGK